MTISDRDLDLLVAEKVMGYSGRLTLRRSKHATDTKPGFRNAPSGAASYWYDRMFTQDDERLYCGKPFAPHPVAPYSVSIVHAFLVVEAMRAKGWSLVLHVIAPAADPKEILMVSAELRKDGEKSGHAFAPENVPRAICLAALRALGVEVS